MIEQQKSTEVNKILSAATPDQLHWVIARLHTKTDQDAAKEAGVHKSVVSRWTNKPDLDRAVVLLLSQTAKAAALILAQSAPEAARALVESLKDAKSRVPAANSILDRAGVTAMQRVDVTTGGEPLTVVFAGLKPGDV